MLLRAALLLIAMPALAIPAFAVAQTAASFTVVDTADSDAFIKISECTNASDDLSFNWTVGTTTSGFTVPTGAEFKLVASDQQSCPSGANNYVNTSTISANGSLTGSFGTGNPPSTVPSVLANAAFTAFCSDTTKTRTIFFCVNLTDASGAVVAGTTAATGTIVVDATVPPPPSLNTPTPGESALNLSWSAGTGTGTTTGSSASYEWHVDPAGAPGTGKSGTVTGTSVRVTGLTNGQTYDVTIYALSPGGNKSAASNVLQGTPVPVTDFWEKYRSEPGAHEQGGCSTGGGAFGLLALLPLLPVAARRSRRRS